MQHFGHKSNTQNKKALHFLVFGENELF